MLTREQVADRIGVKVRSVNTMLCDGRLVKPTTGSGRQALWSEEAIDEWLQTRPGRGWRPPTAALDRFMAKVLEDPGTGCWLWQGHVNPNTGYGTFRISQDRRGPAHRRGYELLVGPVADELHLDHLCRVRNCVNPAHLEPVTPRENVMRSTNFTAANARKTLCPQGHPYDEENTRITRGRRHCRECGRQKWRAWYRAQKAGTQPPQP